jgi:hypothetical protein
MPDVAATTLKTIHQHLRIDEEWTVWGDRGFSWMGFRLQQRFFVSLPFEDAGMQVQRVWSVTPVVDDVRAPEDQILGILSGLNRFSVGEALVWDSYNRRVLCHTGAIVHEETLPWRPGQIADYAILALRTCEDRAGQLAELLDGRVSAWPHPQSGHRQEPDEMLYVGERLFVPQGQEPNRYASEEEFAAVYADVVNTPFFSAGGSAEGIVIEVPFGDSDTSLIQLHTDVRHPTFGNGLLCTLKVRLPESVAGTGPKLANELNYLEAQGDLPSGNFGAWCEDQAAGQPLLAHSRFLPNLIYRKLLAVDTARIAVNRAIWAAAVLLGDEAGRIHRFAHEILVERYGQGE